jgi:polysaccharide biosynthesis/export protein
MIAGRAAHQERKTHMIDPQPVIRRRPGVLAILPVVLLGLPAAPALAQEVAVPIEQAREYIIGPEDVLDISVWDNEQLTRSVVVRPDGKISLPLLNDVAAAGLTPMQLRDRLAAALQRFIPEPTVSVITSEINSKKVTVIGEVNQPGRYELRSRSTVLEALALAGGFTGYASRGRRIMVLRTRGETTYTLGFEFNRIAQGDLVAQPNFELEAGDIIIVP